MNSRDILRPCFIIYADILGYKDRIVECRNDYDVLTAELAEFKSPKKIPTREGKLLVELAPTPKILPELRAWFPQARIVGWKFEADGARADALNAARQQITECHTDACVVNGPAYGEGFGVLLSNNKAAHLPHAPALFVTLEKIARRDFPS